MNCELLDFLRCPQSGQRLVLEECQGEPQHIETGSLVSENGQFRYSIRDSIPRFVPESNYADNFGLQWNKFRKTQLDSYSGHPISSNRFWRATGWTPEALKGKWVLDIGCGAGRFAEIALQAGAKVVALDYSSAVEACHSNLKHYPNLHVVQGDIFSLPLLNGAFPFVYSLGVLQHTPDVARAFSALPPMLSEGGRLCVDVYWKRIQTMLQSKYLLRPFTRHIQKQQLFEVLEKVVPRLLPISQFLGGIPKLGRLLKRIVPIADYTSIYPLSANQLSEWALLDTFDMLAPEYDHPQTASTLMRWFEAAGFVEVEVFHEGHLVGRGRKPS